MIQTILAVGTDRSALRVLRNVVFTGLAVLVPIVATLYVIWFAIGLIGRALRPFIGLLEWVGVVGFVRRQELLYLLVDAGIYGDVVGMLSEIVAVVVFVALLLVVGFFARYRYGELVISSFDYLIAAIPGVGTVYQSLRQVGNIVLDETAQEFETVTLVELLSEETYVIAFKTNPPTDAIADATGHGEMETVFVPMAPNPVTGGFLAYVPADRVIDVDLSIDEAVRAILTSGIATGESDEPRPAVLDDLVGSGTLGGGVDAVTDRREASDRDES